MVSAGSATIVVVEGDPAAQELIEQALRGRGHRVLVTGDPEEAVRLGRRIRIDVLVSDVELSGERVSLVERLRSLQGDVRFVRVFDPDDRLLAEVGLPRPFSLEELERAVGRALAG